LCLPFSIALLGFWTVPTVPRLTDNFSCDVVGFIFVNTIEVLPDPGALVSLGDSVVVLVFVVAGTAVAVAIIVSPWF